MVAARAYEIPGLGVVQAGTAWDRILHLIMPTIVLSLLYMAAWSRYTRTSMLEVVRQDYVRTARAKGLGEPVTIPTAAAVANAVYHATGVRVTATPINPVQLCQLLAEHRKEG